MSHPLLSVQLVSMISTRSFMTLIYRRLVLTHSMSSHKLIGHPVNWSGDIDSFRCPRLWGYFLEWPLCVRVCVCMCVCVCRQKLSQYISSINEWSISPNNNNDDSTNPSTIQYNMGSSICMGGRKNEAQIRIEGWRKSFTFLMVITMLITRIPEVFFMDCDKRKDVGAGLARARFRWFARNALTLGDDVRSTYSQRRHGWYHGWTVRCSVARRLKHTLHSPIKWFLSQFQKVIQLNFVHSPACTRCSKPQRIDNIYINQPVQDRIGYISCQHIGKSMTEIYERLISIRIDQQTKGRRVAMKQGRYYNQR